MENQANLEEMLISGALDASLARVYGQSELEVARARCTEVISGFTAVFERSPTALFSAPGRSELGGNHTDHQHGCVLAASINLDALAAVAPKPGGIIRIHSQGYPLIEVDLRELSSRPEERNTSAAIIRGVAARFSTLGCPAHEMGLEAYVISNIPGGSGLSSSAAFEILIGIMLNSLFNNDAFSPVELAKIGQYAENVYFEKPSGLMDQTASSVGGVVAIDFFDPTEPIVKQIEADFTAAGYALCILDSGADHADLTDEYAAITRELSAVCRYFGKKVLRDIPEEDFLAALSAVRKVAGDRAVLRAIHFYRENRCAVLQAEALSAGDMNRFLALVRESGHSSAKYLQNITPLGQTTKQELMLTIALCERILNGRGAVRVHGGGFGGTAQAFVPLDMLEDFRNSIEAVLGSGCCHVLNTRPVGGIRISKGD